MITDDLFNKILIQPYESLNAKEIYIVSGYATPAMVFKHFNETPDIKVNLLIGMAKNGGLNRQTHSAFKAMVQNDFAGKFNCKYLNLSTGVHSKIYGWFNTNGDGITGFLGSANYSLNAFTDRQKEAMTQENPHFIFDYYSKMEESSINCINDDEIEEFFTLKSGKEIRGFNLEPTAKPDLLRSFSTKGLTEGVDYIKLSLVTDNKGPLRVPEKSGLNWGQRPEHGREPNQAYIPIPINIQKSDFFPELKIPFIIYTDDNQFLDCVRAQGDYGKGLHTYRNNSILGKYFRKRIGVQDGAMVHLDDLIKYGRTDVTIFKIDNENYMMDFSSKKYG